MEGPRSLVKDEDDEDIVGKEAAAAAAAAVPLMSSMLMTSLLLCSGRGAGAGLVGGFGAAEASGLGAAA
jgi:hypothetical protein